MQNVKNALHLPASSLGGGQVPKQIERALLEEALIVTDALAEAEFILIEARVRRIKKESAVG
jgi:hypothetical protein